MNLSPFTDSAVAELDGNMNGSRNTQKTKTQTPGPKLVPSHVSGRVRQVLSHDSSPDGRVQVRSTKVRSFEVLFLNVNYSITQNVEESWNLFVVFCAQMRETERRSAFVKSSPVKLNFLSNTCFDICVFG